MSAKTIASAFSVSGPEIDRTYETDGQAISAAITFAERSKTDVSFYVRDGAGETVARVERRGRGVTVHRVAEIDSSIRRHPAIGNSAESVS